MSEDLVFRLSRSGVTSIGEAEALLAEIIRAAADPSELGPALAELRRLISEIDSSDRSAGKTIPELLYWLDGVKSPVVARAVERLCRAMWSHEPADEIQELNRFAAAIEHPPRHAAAAPAPATRSSLAELLKIELNEMYLDQLAERLGHAVAPLLFVGAGMSAGSGFPVWSAFLRQIAARERLEAEIEPLLAAGLYEDAADVVERTISRAGFDSWIRGTFGREPEVRGAVQLLPELANGAVLTTNYDRVLERAFAAAGRPLHAFSGARLQGFAAADRDGDDFLLKIHGDVDALDDRVLTLTEYERHYGAKEVEAIDFSRPLPDLLRSLFRRRSVLFVGCSLVMDRTVRLLAAVTAESQVDRRTHFALCEAPEGGIVARRQELMRLGICPIFYHHGRHDEVPVLLEQLVLRSRRHSRRSPAFESAVRAAMKLLRKPLRVAKKLEEKVKALTHNGRVPLRGAHLQDVQSQAEAIEAAIAETNHALDAARGVVAADEDYGTTWKALEAIDRACTANEKLLLARDSVLGPRHEPARLKRDNWYVQAEHAADEANRAMNAVLQPRR